MKNSYKIDRILNAGLFIVAFVFLTLTVSFAQLSVVPSGTAAGRQDYEQKGERVQAISLPFFDDFATTNTANANSAWWVPGGGVYVNNTLATTQPSLNIATFDGLSSGGFPYESANPISQNFTDTLTSQPINLSGLSVTDSLYLSFYWLSKGLGEKPDSGDVFRMEFKDRSGAWQIAWSNDGETLQDSLFKQEMILIRDSQFFHGDFQFRFRSFGRASGAYDTWHLDYVYLNKNRTKSVPFVYDLAMRKPLTSLLKQFTAMPMRQYIKDPAAFTVATVYSDGFCNKNVSDITTATMTISASGKELYSSNLRDIFFPAFTSKVLAMPMKPLTLTAKDSSLRATVKLTTTDNRTPGVDLFRNDLISSQTTLSNFYAYDDGSAEHGVQMNQKLGRTAVRFVIPGSDTLAGLKMNLLPFNKNVAGQTFTIQVWDDQEGRPGTVLRQQSFTVSYPVDRNGFLYFKFSNPTVVKDIFYIGWLQINEQPIVVGFDRNSTLGKDQIFVNLSNQWGQEKSLTGSLMIRPVTGGQGNTTVLGTEPINAATEYFFPNPARSMINWKNGSLSKINVYSMSGQLFSTIYPRQGERAVYVSQMPAGMYIFDAFDGKRNFAQRIIIVK